MTSPIHFTGKERDGESGLDYFGARYFSAAQGRFTSPDHASVVVPIPYADLENPQSLNLYAYVENDPVSAVDRTGHAKGSSNYKDLGGGWTMRTDGARGADHVNVHFEKGGRSVKYKIEGGELRPAGDEKVPNWVLRSGTQRLEQTGKFDLAARKGAFGSGEEPGGRAAGEGGRGTEGGGPRGGMAALAILQVVDMALNAYADNKFTQRTGLGHNAEGGLTIVDPAKAAATLGEGTTIQFTSPSGDVGTFQVQDGKFVGVGDHAGCTIQKTDNGTSSVCPA